MLGQNQGGWGRNKFFRNVNEPGHVALPPEAVCTFPVPLPEGVSFLPGRKIKIGVEVLALVGGNELSAEFHVHQAVYARPGGRQALDHGPEFVVADHAFAADPAFDLRTAPRRMQQPDGHVEFLVQLTGEKIAYRREIADGFGRTDLPRAGFQVGVGRERQHVIHPKMADLGKLRALFFLRKVIGLFHRPLHVRLPGAKPHVAEEHVGELGLARFGRRSELVRPARLHRCEPNQPFAVRVGFGRLALPGQRDGYFFAGFRPTPDGKRLLALQHDVVGENPGEPHLPEGGLATEKEKENQPFHGVQRKIGNRKTRTQARIGLRGFAGTMQLLHPSRSIKIKRSPPWRER